MVCLGCCFVLPSEQQQPRYFLAFGRNEEFRGREVVGWWFSKRDSNFDKSLGYCVKLYLQKNFPYFKYFVILSFTIPHEGDGN